MYLALRPPWGGGTNAPPPGEGSAVAVAPGDAGVTSGKRKKKRRRYVNSSGAPTGPEDYYEETEPEITPLTSAERRLEERGDDVRLPPQKLDMGGDTEARPLEDAEINATISAQSRGVKDCVVQGATGTDLRATITVQMVVDGTGRVTRTRLEAPRYLFDQGLLNCARRAAARMKFPATGAPTLVTLPINLG